MAAEDGGHVEPPDLPDGLFADDEAPGAVVPKKMRNMGLPVANHQVAKIVRSRESSGIPAHRLRKTLMNTRPADTPRTGRGVRLVLEAEVSESRTSGPRSRSRRSRS